MRLVYGMMLLAMFGFTTVGLTGCSSDTDTVSTEAHDDHDHDGDEHASHDHSGWWCNEHGVPEDECALCKTSLVADFKAKGDWCDEHDRPMPSRARFETETSSRVVRHRADEIMSGVRVLASRLHR